MNRGIAYISLQQCQRAIADFNQVLEINPQSADAYRNRGIAYVILGNLQQARENWEQAATLYKQQNDSEGYQLVQENLKKLSQIEAQQYFAPGKLL